MTLLSEASVIVVPFRADVVPGSPLKLYEAVGVGVPVVVPVGLDREVEKFDHVVAYDPARGVGGLAEALGQAVAQAPLGRVELERVRSEVSWDRRARDVLRHLGPFIGSDRKR